MLYMRGVNAVSIIKVANLHKEYRTYKRFPGIAGAVKTLFTTEYTVTKGVDDISFNIEAGEAVGYLGPNGAGKSTMIKMLTGILVPTSGDIKVNGVIPYERRKELAKDIGVVFGQRSQLWWDIPVIDSFELHKYIYKIPHDKYEERLHSYIELLDMQDFMNKPVRQLSLGQRMRAEIALALIHEPKILFLDEPTIGLDVVGKYNIREFLKYINKERKTTILLTTHDLKDIEEICDRLLIVNDGVCFFDGTVSELKSSMGNVRKKVTLEFAEDPGNVEIPQANLLKDNGPKKVYEFSENSDILSSLGMLQKDIQIKDISIEEADIEEVMRSVFNKINAKSETKV